MKALKISSLNSSMYYFVILICTSLLMHSCATTSQSFSNSAVVPGAKGSVKVQKDKNSNYNIELTIMHLADSKRLTPPKNMYIVWMETEESSAKNIGQLNTSSSLLSKTMKSSLKTVSSSKPTRFFITAEDDSNIQYPGGVEVLSTTSF